MSPASSTTCDCGKPKVVGALQCRSCSDAALKKIIKWAALVGAILSVICREVPPEYQAPCKTVATVLSSC